MKAWYFSKKEKKLAHGDNRQIQKGRTHKVKGQIEPCRRGLHASKRLIDALSYAPGPYIWRVEMSGNIISECDKLCASERTYIQGFDATVLFRKFARKQALINIEKIKPYTGTDSYDLIVEYLKTGNEDIRSAAWSAARSAANKMLTHMVNAELKKAAYLGVGK